MRMTKEAQALQELRRGPRSSYDLMLRVSTTQPERLVWGLRQRGFEIYTEMVPMEEGRGQYGIYHLMAEPNQVNIDPQEELFSE